MRRVLEQRDSAREEHDVVEEKARRQRWHALRRLLKQSLVERLGLESLSQIVSSGDVTRARGELRVACQASLNTPQFGELLPEDRETLIAQVLDEVCGLGPLQGLLEDDTVTEVVVNGTESLFFERDGRLCQSDVSFESAEQIMVVIDRILAPLGRRLDRANPIVNARLANGDRVNAVAAPVAINGPAVTIRKFSHRITSLDELVHLGSIPIWYATLLKWAVRLRQDIAVAGGTGSGKRPYLMLFSAKLDGMSELSPLKILLSFALRHIPLLSVLRNVMPH
jgi:pilus assembly protein CpaF